MSEVWWVGVGIDPATQGADAAELLNDEIDGMIRELDLDTTPISRILQPDGSERRRYLFGHVIMSDIIDRLGNRIGFGIEHCRESDGRELLGIVQELLNRWEVHAVASVWTWSYTDPRHPAPVECELA